MTMIECVLRTLFYLISIISAGYAVYTYIKFKKVYGTPKEKKTVGSEMKL